MTIKKDSSEEICLVLLGSAQLGYAQIGLAQLFLILYVMVLSFLFDILLQLILYKTCQFSAARQPHSMGIEDSYIQCIKHKYTAI